MRYFIIVLLISNVVFAMPFSFTRVLLDKMSSPFGVERTIRDPNTGREETGYHTGVDYTTNPTMEKDYVSGVWGFLKNNPNSEFNTITIDPSVF